MKKLLLLLLLCATPLLAAERYVVTPRGDYYPIPKGQSALTVAKAHGLVSAEMSACTDKATFGFVGAGSSPC